MKHLISKLIFLFITLITVYLPAAKSQNPSQMDSIKDVLRKSSNSEQMLRVAEYVIKNDYQENFTKEVLRQTNLRVYLEKKDSCMARYHLLLSEWHFAEGNMESFKQEIFASLPYYRANTEKIYDLAHCYNNLGYYYNNCSKTDSARYYLVRSAEILEDSNLEEYSTYRTTLTNIGASFLCDANSDSAYFYINKAMEFSIATKDTTCWMENLNQLGVLARRSGDLNECINYCNEALELAEATRNLRMQIFIFSNLSTLYNDCGRFDQAIDFSRKAVILSENSLNSLRQGIALSNHGFHLSHHNQYKAAADTLILALKKLDKTENIRIRANSYFSLIRSFIGMNQPNRADSVQRICDRMAYKFSNPLDYANYLISKASVYSVQKKYTQAIELYQELAYYTRKHNVSVNMLSPYEEYSEALEKTGQYERALHYMKKAHSLQAKETEENYIRQMSEMYIKYQTHENEQKILKLKLDHQQSELKASHLQMYIMIMIIVILAGMACFWLHLQKMEAQKERFRNEQKAREMEFSVLKQETELNMRKRYLEGLEEERKHFSQEIHDGICNDLLGVEMLINASPKLDEKEQKRLIQLIESSRQNMRNISHQLIPPSFSNANVFSIIKSYLEQLDNSAKETEISFISRPEACWNIISNKTALELYRLVQEGVSNALRHSHAKKIEVYLSLDEENCHLGLLIKDNGCGFDVNKIKHGLGLRVMNERVHSVNGSLEIISGTGGTSILIKIDLLGEINSIVSEAEEKPEMNGKLF